MSGSHAAGNLEDDIFGDVVNTEREVFDAGAEAARSELAADLDSHQTGKEAGFARGYEYGFELGFMNEIATSYVGETSTGDRGRKHIKKLKGLIQKFPKQVR